MKDIGRPELGTALKPGHELIVLARKPLSERTIALNVLEHGTGAINVDATRVGLVGNENPGGSGNRASWRKLEGRTDIPQPTPNNTSSAGRWPPDFVLSHHPDCRDECIEGCPVAELGRQSGETKSKDGGLGGLDPGMWQGKQQVSRGGHNDKGTAARFFPQFAWEEADFWPFLYQAKASRSERDKGLEEFPEIISEHLSTVRCRKCGKQKQTRDISRCQCSEPDWEGTFSHRRNPHATVKPLALMRWLITLITPPGGVVLDPFAGSGSTLVAAKELGFQSIGIEMQNTDDEPYCEIAKRRLMAAQAGLL